MNAPGSSEQGPLQSSVSWVGTGSMITHGGPCVKDSCMGTLGSQSASGQWWTWRGVTHQVNVSFEKRIPPLKYFPSLDPQ